MNVNNIKATSTILAGRESLDGILNNLPLIVILIGRKILAEKVGSRQLAVGRKKEAAGRKKEAAGTRCS
jgi:hypothetical protein